MPWGWVCCKWDISSFLYYQKLACRGSSCLCVWASRGHYAHRLRFYLLVFSKPQAPLGILTSQVGSGVLLPQQGTWHLQGQRPQSCVGTLITPFPKEHGKPWPSEDSSSGKRIGLMRFKFIIRRNWSGLFVR